MTTEKLTKEQAENIEKIAESLTKYTDTFTWNKTKEGYEYWDKIYNALKRIAENGLKNSEKKVCEKCGQEIK